jgi:hypothetical protein
MSSTEQDDPGKAAKAFVDAVGDAAKKIKEPATADPKVVAAVHLGWLVDTIVAGLPFALEGQQLGDDVGFKAQGNRVQTLAKTLGVTGYEGIVTTLCGGKPAIGGATEWRDTLYAELLGADIHYARACDLGERLGKLHRDGYTVETLTDVCVAPIRARLDSLSTVLPPHAARGVAMSIERWIAFAPVGTEDDIRRAAEGFADQVELWRQVVTGEKLGTELLAPQNYLDAGQRLAGKYSGLAGNALKQNKVLVIAALVLAIGGVVGGLAIALSGASQTAGTATGLAGLLAAVGLTWKGIGGALGKLVGALEAPLWGAELDEAVGDALSLVPAVEQGRLLPWADPKLVDGGDYAGRAALAANVRAALSP